MPNTNDALSSTAKIAIRPIKNSIIPHKAENINPFLCPISAHRVEALGAKINTNVMIPYQ